MSAMALPLATQSFGDFFQSRQRRDQRQPRHVHHLQHPTGQRRRRRRQHAQPQQRQDQPLQRRAFRQRESEHRCRRRRDRHDAHRALSANTQYTIKVESGLKDTDGNSFTAYTAKFTTGTAGPVVDPDIVFNKTNQSTSLGYQYTSLAWGPDNKLYAGTLDGQILRFSVGSGGTLGTPEVFNTVNTGSGDTEFIIGLEFDPGEHGVQPDPLDHPQRGIRSDAKQRAGLDREAEPRFGREPSELSGLRRRPAAVGARPRRRSASLRPGRRAVFLHAEHELHGCVRCGVAAQ